jgi:hypothetical protein
MNKDLCEVCEKNVSEMEFVTPILLSEGTTTIFKGKICLSCWGLAPSDDAIVMTILQHRATKPPERSEK